MSNNNAEISSGMCCCHGYKNRSSNYYIFFSLSAPLSLSHTLPLCLHSLCSQLQHGDSLSNKKPPYLPFSGTFQRAAFYNIQVEKIKNKVGWEKKKKKKEKAKHYHSELGCKYCPLLLCRGMFGTDLTESAPFTCLLIFFLLFFFFFCCFAFIAWRLPFFATPSLFQTRLWLCRELSGSKSHAAQWQSGALSCSKGATQSLTPPESSHSESLFFFPYWILDFCVWLLG